jgi:uncharacterized protein YbjQ (UPF0145 family)
VIGEVFSITVQSRNIGSQLGPAFKALAGGELRGMTKLLSASRTEAQDRLIEAATARGADAILAMRFDVSELQNVGQETCATAPPSRSAARASAAAGPPRTHRPHARTAIRWPWATPPRILSRGQRSTWYPAPGMCRQLLRRPAPRRPAVPGRRHVAFAARQRGSAVQEYEEISRCRRH